MAYSEVVKQKTKSDTETEKESIPSIADTECTKKIDTYKELTNFQRHKMDEIINLTSDNYNENVLSRGGTNEDFKAQRRQRKMFNKRIGTAAVNDDLSNGRFEGEERKVWLYIYRVKRHVIPENIISFIKLKPGYKDLMVEVKELPNTGNRLKCFVVTAPLSKKDEMYNPDFWPTGVGVKRFSFVKHREYLDKNGADFLVETNSQLCT